MEKEAMYLRDSKEGHIGRFGGRKGRGNDLIINSEIRQIISKM